METKEIQQRKRYNIGVNRTPLSRLPIKEVKKLNKRDLIKLVENHRMNILILEARIINLIVELNYKDRRNNRRKQ